MNIEIVDVKTENKGKYRVAHVSYTYNGKLEGKDVMSFGASGEVFKVVSQAQRGDVFDVKNEKIPGKDGKEYWNWTAITSAGKSSPSETPQRGNASPRSSYETPEERAQRQVYIIRQSSISAAVELLTHNAPKSVVDENAVITIADKFVNYVLNGKEEELTEVEVV